MDAQIKKGILDMCILHCILDESQYGYDIIQKMHKYFPEVNESTFYSILRRLKNDGLATVYYGEKSNGPKRKYYQITAEGKSALKKLVSDWKTMVYIIKIIGID